MQRQMISASGQHLFQESGAYIASGICVVIQSGIHVEQVAVLHSGAVTVDSGLYVIAESGTSVVVQSGLHVEQVEVVQSGIMDVREYGWHILSGEWRPKAVCDSGEMVVCSGLYVVAQISVVVSGIDVTVDISGDPVTMSGDHVFIESGIANIHGYHLLSGEWRPVSVCDSGEIVVCSGLYVVTQPSIAVSGTVEIQSGGVIDVREYGWHILSGEWRRKAVCNSGEMVVCSGLHVVVISGTGEVSITTPTDIFTCSGTNPMTVPETATPLCSGPCISVIVKALSTNSGDIYAGGYTVGNPPLCASGFETGFLLEAGEAFNIDIDNTGKVQVCACTSGDKVTFIANNL